MFIRLLFFVDAQDSCDVCSMALFNAYQICIQCGFSVCIDCKIQHVKCDNGRRKEHTVQPCVVHSSALDLANIIEESERIAEQWNIRFAKVPRQRNSRISLAELMVLYPNCQVSEHSLQKSLLVMANIEENADAFDFLFKEGVSFMVECHDALNKDVWNPDYLARQFGDSKGTLKYVDQSKPDIPNADISKFFSQLKTRREETDDYGRLKLVDFPEEAENISMTLTLPFVVKELHAAVPFKRHLLPNGPLNMASHVHWAMHKPDVQAKFFAGDGCFKGATGVHVDLIDAGNICVHAEECPEKDRDAQNEFLRQHLPEYERSKLKRCPAALWHIFLEESYEDLKR